MNKRAVVAAIAAACLLSSSGLAVSQQPAAPTDATRYVPGLGEFMLSAQARHAKLWFAGNAQNWDLADYLIDELKEGLDDAAKFVPTLKGLPIGTMVGSIMDTPVEEVEKAVKAKDRNRFVASFDKLTEACNACHQAANRPFIVIQRPASLTYPNQSFAPPKK